MPTQCLAVTLGDPRGVGPEVVAHAIRYLREQGDETEFILVGPDGLDPGLGRYEGVGRFDGSEASAAAKRKYCDIPLNDPRKTNAPQNSQKLPARMAMVAITAPVAPISAPVMNPMRRPTRFM